MATWLPHIKLQFGGTLGQPVVEEWSNTIRFKMNGAPFDTSPTDPSLVMSSGELEDALAAIVVPLDAWFRNGNSRINQVARLTYAKLNMINAQGKQYDQNTHRRDITPTPGGSSFAAPPWYQTLALTMRTEKSRGRAHSGRIFPPVVDAGPQNLGPYIDGTVATGMVSNFVTCLDAICQALADTALAPNIDVRPVIASPATTTGPNPGPALLQVVTGVVADRIPDVQHRRTNRLQRLETALAPVAGA